jgi:plasmid maintenance system antidote protein VapI
MKTRVNLTLKSKIIKEFGTAEDFANHLGKHPSVVSRVVRGRLKLSQDEQKKWAKELGCHPDAVFETSDFYR